ncbi:MAG: hypothetical protein ACRER2_02965 [Methylococcales bacterium]
MANNGEIKCFRRVGLLRVAGEFTDRLKKAVVCERNLASSPNLDDIEVKI